MRKVFQEELAQGGEKQGLLHTFDSSGRMALGAVSYIYAETRSRRALVASSKHGRPRQVGPSPVAPRQSADHSEAIDDPV